MSNKFLIDKVLEGGAQSFSSSDSCRELISIFRFVYVARCGQQEARETWQLLKLLAPDVKDELLEAMAD